MKAGDMRDTDRIRTKVLRARLAGLFAGLLVMVWPAQAQIGPADCLPSARGQAQLVTLRANFHTVTGALGRFDPCEASVRWRLPPGPGRAPLMISVHGGGGIHDVLKSDDPRFNTVQMRMRGTRWCL